MAEETEIKLRVSPAQWNAAQALRWMKAATSGPVQRQQLRSVYFDTPEHGLRQQGLSLRVRQIGEKRLQTVKSEDGSMFSRQEWECEIAGNTPDREKFAHTPLKRLKRKTPLKPVFETDVTRTVVPVAVKGGTIEIAFDSGAVKTRRSREPIREIEIELKKGTPAALAKLAAQLAKTVDAAYEVRAKADRGYALAAGNGAAAEHARPIALPEAASVAEAFRIIGRACLHHLAANEAAVRAGEAEGVHQMRVGLRRLRAAMSLFKDLIGDAQSRRIKRELKWLTEELGPARDTDVFVRESVEPLKGSLTEMDSLHRDLEHKRDDGFARARAAVESPRYRTLVLQTALWLADGRWNANARRARLRDGPVVPFATALLARRRKKIVRKLRKLDELDAIHRHKLRIAAKKLRYAVGFFAGPLGGKRRRKEFGAALAAVQDALGRLNDIAVHRRLAGSYTADGQPCDGRPAKAFAIGFVAGREDEEVKACLVAAHKAGRRLKALRPPWS